MKVAGEYEFAASREQVWAALHDPALLARALPGARRLEPAGTDSYAITVDVGVGSVKGTYEGTFALSEEDEPASCTVRANASGRPGSVETVARMRLSECDGGGALLAYEADASVTGPLAGVGQRLIGGAARRTTEQFLSALDRRIVAPPDEEEIGHEIVAAPREPPVADPRVFVAGAVAGAACALLGVAVGRWTARR